MLKTSGLLGIAALVSAGLLLAGCEEDEQGRMRSRMQGQNDI